MQIIDDDDDVLKQKQTNKQRNLIDVFLCCKLTIYMP